MEPNTDPRAIALDYCGPVFAALSEWGELETAHAGEQHRIAFARGVIDRPLERLGPADGTGVRVRFKPDPDIFGTHTFDLRAVLHTLCELAFLHAGMRFTFTDERTGKTDTFHFPDGLAAFVNLLNTGEEVLHDPIRLIGKDGDIRVEVAVQWRKDAGVLRSYVNATFAPEGGTHVHGLHRGLGQALRAFAKRHDCWPENLDVEAEDIRDGLTAVVSIDHPDPQWMGATRSHLGNPDAAPAVARVVRTEFGRHLDAHPDLGHRLCDRIALNAEARVLAWATRRSRSSS